MPLVGRAPERRTEVLLTDDVDTANGSASVVLRPVMRIFADPPESRSVLNDYEDYLWALIVHEYTHILHLDWVSGLPDVVNRVFGKLFVPNGFTPRWMTEGYAVYEESNLSAGGRIRSAVFDMWLRANIIEGRPFRLDETSHSPTLWPTGSLSYLYGGRFLRYVAERVGPEKLGPYFDHYGARPIPYAINQTANDVFAQTWIQLYDDWLASLTVRYREQLGPVREAGLTSFAPLTRSGEQTDLPRFSRDGERVFYSEGGRDRRYAIRSVRLDGSDDRLETRLWQPVTFDVSPDNRFLVFAASEVYRENYVVEELFLTDRERQTTERLSFGLRGTDPAFHPAGDRIAFVGRGGSGATYLGEFSLTTRQARVLHEPRMSTRLFTPAYALDGNALFFTEQVGRFQQLRRLDLVSGAVTKLGPTDAMVLEPSVTREGDVVFTSDRTGVYNLYRVTPATGSWEQVTNVETGAFRPAVSVHDSSVAFVTYTSRGYDIARIEAPALFRDPMLAHAGQRPEPVFHDDERDVEQVRPYRPIETLLPQYWTPLLVTDPLGSVIGVSTDGSDIVGRHSYRLQATYGLASREPGFSAAYTNSALNPSVGLGVSSGIAQIAGFAAGEYDRRWTASISSGITFTRRSRELATSIVGGYEFRSFDPQLTQAFRPDGPVPVLPRKGTSGALSIGVNLSTARATTNAFSAERGMTFNLTVRRSGPETLGTFSFATVEARSQAYVTMPWRRHHVLAFRGAMGVGRGDLGSRQLFSLGGLTVDEPLLQLIEGRGAGADVLRGYPPGFIAGSSFGLGTLEYRFPVSDLNRGAFSLPFFLRRLHAAAFTDVGTVGNDQLALERPRVSVGLELRLELLIRYDYGSLLRVGYAQGLSEGGGPTAYVTVGSTF